MVTSTQIAQELRDDPAGIGYRDGTGVFRPLRQILRLLGNARSQPQTRPAPQIPAPLDKDAMWDALGVLAQGKVPPEMLAVFAAEVDDGDRDALGRWLRIGVVKGYLSRDEATAIRQQITATIPDPSWPAAERVAPRQIELWSAGGLPVDLVKTAITEAQQ